jgi:hypothetical protein
MLFIIHLKFSHMSKYVSIKYINNNFICLVSAKQNV